MRKILLSFFIFLIGSSADSQIVNIPDSFLKNALLNHSPVIDLNGDGQIQVSEAVAFTGSLNLIAKGITNITGLNAFTNISGLLFDGNFVNNLTIGNFPFLTTFTCANSVISNLSLSNLPSLSTLNTSFNFLSSLSLSSFPLLRLIECSGNNITSLTLPNSPLEVLHCQGNKLSSLVMPNTSVLKDLDCRTNLLTSLSLGDVPQLQNLNCDGNKLSSLNYSNPVALKFLYCGNNRLTSLSIVNHPILERLACDNNLLTSLTINNLPALQNFSCGGNLLTSLTIPVLPSLKVFYCVDNQLSSLPLPTLNSLDQLYCSDNQITSLSITDYPLLRYLVCERNQLSTLTLKNLPSLLSMQSKHNNLNSLTISGLPLLNYLDCSNNNLSYLSLNSLPLFQRINCDTTSLATLDLSNVPAISFSCLGCTNLSYINIKNGSISATGNVINLPSSGLQSICVDDSELAFINNTVISQLPGQNISVSSFCNFNPNGNYNTITGNVRFDGNANGCNNLDSGMINLRMNIDDGVQSGATFTSIQGAYKFFVGLNSNTINPVFTTTWFNSAPPDQTISFSNYGNSQVADFCVTPVGVHPDLEITLLPIGPAIPGFDVSYKLAFSNKGNQIQSGTVTLTFDNSKINFLYATPPVTNQGTGSLSWFYSGLSSYETRIINLTFHVNSPPVVNSGDVLSFTATINPVTGDETPGDNIFNLNQIVVNSFDPNDKLVTEGSQITIDKLNNYLHYIVRFQNTGSSNAISVVIKDTLSTNLNWNTFEPIIASHPFRTVITKGNFVEFIFDGINLPPKSVNETASNGFVSFKIKPKNNLSVGDIIQNTASIYFDYNLPIVTNTVISKIYKPNNNNSVGLTIYSTPVKDYLNFSVTQGVGIKGISLYNSAGQRMNVRVTEVTSTNKRIDMTNFANGIYILELITDQGKVSQKFLITK